MTTKAMRKLRDYVPATSRKSLSKYSSAIVPSVGPALPLDASTLGDLIDAFLGVARAEAGLSALTRRRKAVRAAKARGDDIDPAVAASVTDQAIATRKAEASKAKAHRRAVVYEARKAGGADAVALVSNIFSGRTLHTLGKIADPEAAYAAAIDFVEIAIKRPGALDPAARPGLLRGCLLGVGADALAIKVASGRATPDEIKLAMALSSSSRLDIHSALAIAATAPAVEQGTADPAMQARMAEIIERRSRERAAIAPSFAATEQDEQSNERKEEDSP